MWSFDVYGMGRQLDWRTTKADIIWKIMIKKAPKSIQFWSTLQTNIQLSIAHPPLVLQRKQKLAIYDYCEYGSNALKTSLLGTLKICLLWITLFCYYWMEKQKAKEGHQAVTHRSDKDLARAAKAINKTIFSILSCTPRPSPAVAAIYE